MEFDIKQTKQNTIYNYKKKVHLKLMLNRAQLLFSRLYQILHVHFQITYLTNQHQQLFPL
jgi:hypothetical protein